MVGTKKPTAIYFTDCKYRRENVKYICEHFDTCIDGLLSPDYDVVFWPRNKKTGQEFPRSYIVSNTTGVDHLPMSKKVISLQGETSFLSSITPTAEHTMGLIHAVHRRLTGAHDAVFVGEWDRYKFPAPRMLSRSTLGIIGYGRLGKLVEKYARNMFKEVMYYDPVEGGTSIEAVLHCADVLTIHAGGSRNLPMIDYKELIQLPKDAIVINTARGNVLDLPSALTLVEEGHLWGVGVDCFSIEPPILTKQQKKLMEEGRFIVTPHIGGSTEDAWYETERFVINKVLKETQK